MKGSGMKQIALSIILLVCLGPMVGRIHAQATLDQRVSELSKQISDGLTENQKRTIAVVEFGDLEGQVTNFGRFVAEELITRLYQTKKFKVIERQLLNKVVAEQKLSLTGMIDQTSAQKLGKLLGVDAIASGTVTDLGKTLRVNARLIDTSTGEIFAVAATEIAKDESVLTLIRGSVGASETLPTSASGTTDKGNAITSKDIGSLRIVLKSVMPIKLKDQNGQRVNGIRCSFEFLNRETQRPIVVALNAFPGKKNSYGQGEGRNLGEVLRATLLDEGGMVWSLSASGVTGMSIVSAGRRSSSESISVFSPTDIPSLLQRKDERGTNMMTDADLPQLGPFPFVLGTTTPIPPGETVTVIMSFVQDAGETTSGPLPKFFQMNTEIVVGVVTEGTKKSYSLHNVIFDRVSLSAGGL